MCGLEYDDLLIRSDLIMDQAWDLLRSLPSGTQPTSAQTDACIQLISELEGSLERLRTLRDTYRHQLDHSQSYDAGIRSYAQSLSLNAPQLKGDLFHD